MAESTDIDRDALERAMRMAREDPDCRELIDADLKNQPWEEVARRAAFHCQTRSLRLKPWEFPPLAVVGPPFLNEREEQAANLLNKMTNAGISRFERDPVHALEVKETDR